MKSNNDEIFGILIFFVILFGMFTIIIGIPSLGECYRKDKEISELQKQIKYQQELIDKLGE